MTFRDVEDRLVEAAELWLRTPADQGFNLFGRSCFATDAPWHLLTKRARVDCEAELVGIEYRDGREAVARGTSASRVMGLTSAEVDRRDSGTALLAMVAEVDRPLVVAAVMQQARTGRRVDWSAMLPVAGKERGKEGVRKRYMRALEAVAARLGRARIAA